MKLGELLRKQKLDLKPFHKTKFTTHRKEKRGGGVTLLTSNYDPQNHQERRTIFNQTYLKALCPRNFKVIKH